ncbi:lysozyme [Comamonas testosteroni]|uniref:Lysozyme n=1 Tax=Comamonas testosteroni TaxID=285 RepID=A0A8B4S9P2_COMTE|nr:lysozyme [Comamonas testosteroni]EHN64295.1 glycoside hydrolase, family 24 [Comamonas testosteroni ATCC 11996]QQN67812.1 lysozyme [Comamonas testosteroni]SUY79000.1 Phage-related lysozyme (muraminidase) [Comamonas testosteroni]
MSWKSKFIAIVGAGAAALAVPLVQHYEGTVFSTYRDPVGIVTACTGHTGPELKMGQTYTREQCEEMLYKDLAKHANALSCVRTPLTDGQRAAFLSFAFNVGDDAFCRSTLVRKANAGDINGACAELSRWTYASGKQLPGLVRRRAAERQLCEQGLA